MHAQKYLTSYTICITNNHFKRRLQNESNVKRQITNVMFLTAVEPCVFVTTIVFFERHTKCLAHDKRCALNARSTGIVFVVLAISYFDDAKTNNYAFITKVPICKKSEEKNIYGYFELIHMLL